MIGDVIFHCHLYPHFMEGMWTLWKIYDRLQDGTGELPDGTPIVSDGSANGWNNIVGARRYETLVERFFEMN